MIYTISDFRRDMRYGEYAWPGGYQRYFVMSNGEALSFDMAKACKREVLEAIRDRDNSGWRIVGADINYEDGELVCRHSGLPIPASYL